MRTPPLELTEVLLTIAYSTSEMTLKDLCIMIRKIRDYNGRYREIISILDKYVDEYGEYTVETIIKNKKSCCLCCFGGM